MILWWFIFSLLKYNAYSFCIHHKVYSDISVGIALLSVLFILLLQFLILERSIKKYFRVYRIRHLKFGLDQVLSFGIDLHASVLSEWFWVCFCSHALVIKRPCATINYPVYYIPLYHYSIYHIPYNRAIPSISVVVTSVRVWQFALFCRWLAFHSDCNLFAVGERCENSITPAPVTTFRKSAPAVGD